MEALGHKTSLRDRRYVASLARRVAARQAIEVGCYVGLTTRAIVGATPEITVHAIDHFQGNRGDRVGELVEQHGSETVRETFCRNMADVLFRRVFLHVGTSEQYAHIWPFAVDLVYIDADHEYESVRQDIELWRQHVRPGGLIAGHDYGVFDGVDQAVETVLGRPDEVEGFVWVKQL